MKLGVYVVGPPGVGKSTFTRLLLARYDKLAEVRLKGQLWGIPLIKDGQMAGVELGRHRATFSGTDALGMAVNPDAVSWLKHSAGVPDMELVIAEGARLANASFFEAMQSRAERFIVFRLDAEDKVLDARCAARGSQQNSSWRKGARTRAARAAYVASHLGAELYPLPTDQRAPEELVHLAAERLWPNE